jgi:hypothetical protein
MALEWWRLKSSPWGEDLGEGEMLIGRIECFVHLVKVVDRAGTRWFSSWTARAI